jgi:valyl-tRNA synthetase
LLSLGESRPSLPETAMLDVKHRWILSRLDETISDIEHHLDAYNWSEALRSLHRFVWSEYCDWYIELAKLDLGGERAAPTGAVLVHVLDHVLRLLHPVMPFITEELWSRLRPDAGSIMVARWPASSGARAPEAEATMGRFQDVVTSLRRLKVDHGIPQSRRIPVSLVAGRHASEVRDLSEELMALARLASLEVVDAPPAAAGHARVLTAAGIEASVVLDDVVDLDAQRRRLRKRIDEADETVRRSESKLADTNFASRAPAAVVDRERGKLAEARAARAKLEEQLRALG